MGDERTDEAEIRRIVMALGDAMRAKDADALLAHAAPDMLTFGLAPPLEIRGTDRDDVKAWMDGFEGPIGYEIRGLEVAVSGAVAWATSLNRLTGVTRDGVRGDLWMRSTIGLRKRDGRWIMAHQHASVPFHMDGSYRAAVDLKPDGE